MKKAVICLLSLFIVLGLSATVFAQNGDNGDNSKVKICKPGAIPVLSGPETQLFQAASHFEAQCTCNQVAEHYQQFVCYATPSVTSANVPPLWYCLCSKKKTW